MDEERIVSRMIATRFLKDLVVRSQSGVQITDRPDAQALIAALQDLWPEVRRDSWASKLFIVYCDGVSVGLDIAMGAAGGPTHEKPIS